MAKNPLIQNKPKDIPMSPPERQSMGILDDFAVRKSMQTQEGYIDKLYSGQAGNKVWLYADMQTYSTSQKIITEKVIGANTMQTMLYNGGIYYYNNGGIIGIMYPDIVGDPTKMLMYGDYKWYSYTAASSTAFLKVNTTGVMSVDNNSYFVDNGYLSTSEIWTSFIKNEAGENTNYFEYNTDDAGKWTNSGDFQFNDGFKVADSERNNYSKFIGGVQATDITYTLPTALPASNGVLQSTSGGTLSWITNVAALVGELANVVITSGGDIKPSSNAVNAINIAQADGTNFINFDTTNSALYVGGLTSAPASGAKFMIVDTANMTLRGVTQATAAMTLGSQNSAGSSYVNRLHHFDNNKGNARTEVTFSNSGDSTTDATGNAIWQNNFVSFMVHGARFAANNYLTSGVTGKTSDAGYAYLLAQGGYVSALGIVCYNNVPIYLGSNNTAIVKIDSSAVSITDAKNFVFGTTTGTKIGTGTTQKLAFYNSTPIVKPSAYTQTYSTASKTHPTATAANLSTTAATQTTPWGFASQAQADDIATQVNKMQTDYINLQKVVNALIDDLQALGLVA